MVNFNFAGSEMFLIIKKNENCMNYGYTDDGNGNIVIMNGLIRISTAYTAPYDSYTNLITTYRKAW